jgi:cell wall assembly regulator SMI1
VVVRVLLAAIAVVAVIAGAFWLWSLRDVPPPVAFLPPAPVMPAVVAATPEEVLARFERLLADKAPAILAALQPGLTDEQINAIEAQHGLKLPPDLRALYRWRDGTRPAGPDAFPGHRFVPLGEAVAERVGLQRQVQNATPAQRAAFKTFAGPRDTWLGIATDAAGDGYFLDPGRAENQGSFFFFFAEDGYYVFYPAFRSYLTALCDGHASGALRFGPRGAEIADYAKAETLWARYGAPSAP